MTPMGKPQCPSLWVINTPREQILCDTKDAMTKESDQTSSTTSGTTTTTPESAIALRLPRRMCRESDGLCVRRRLVFDDIVV